jgi:polysaccharide deacetylase 2 family uncharacterized protein YibQ
MRTSSSRSWFLLLLTAAAVPVTSAAAAPDARRAPPRAQVAIIIDDLGEQHLAGLRAIALPGPVAMAFLPGGRFTPAQAGLAHRQGKEVLLHLPLQPAGSARPHPAALRADTGPEQMRQVVRHALDSVPHAAGLNNHQGSLLTQLDAPMDWLMREVAARQGLYFVDSRTSALSVAYAAARRHGVPAAERNVFLDTHRGAAHVRAALDELVIKALRNGRALAIGHPYPETLQVLAEELPRLARYGVRLVAPSELIGRPAAPRSRPPLKLSPALTLATTPALPALPAARSASAH